MYVVKAQEMRELDRQTIEDLGIPSTVLMEVAGRAVAQEVKRRRRGSCKVTVLAGHGNNGGDGLVAARHLAEAGYDTHVWLVGKVERFSDDARRFWEVCQRLSIPTRVFSEDQQEALQRSLDEADVVVDSLLGIGLSGNVRPPMKEVIRMVNRSAVPLVVAADVPSGVNTDNGAGDGRSDAGPLYSHLRFSEVVSLLSSGCRVGRRLCRSRYRHTAITGRPVPRRFPRH